MPLAKKISNMQNKMNSQKTLKSKNANKKI